MVEIKQLNPDESEQIFKLPNSWVEKGKMEEKKKIALKRLKEGVSPESIARVTNLDYEEIENISKRLELPVSVKS